MNFIFRGMNIYPNQSERAEANFSNTQTKNFEKIKYTID